MSQDPKKMLIVTYVFPPYAAVGVYRVLKFCKFLVRHQIQPVILTPENPRVMARDDGLLGDVPSEAVVYRMRLDDFFHRQPLPARDSSVQSLSSTTAIDSPRTRRNSPWAALKGLLDRHFSVPDRGYFWIDSGFRTGLDIIGRENIDYILSSSPPQSVHVLASRLAARCGRPHIVDFRDLWTQNTSYDERSLPAYLRRRDRKMEVEVLTKAAAITVNTATFKKQLLENNSFLRESRVEVVTNGVDPDDFRQAAAAGRRHDRFTMLYTGSLYGRHRDPEFFFAALRRWIDSRPEVADRVHVKFIGNWTPEFGDLIGKYALSDVVDKKDWLPQKELLIETFSADLLLLFQGFDPVLEAAIPRKLHEYLITGRSILAFAPPGEIPELINRYRCGLSLSSPDAEPIISFLDRSLEQWRIERQGGLDHRPPIRSLPELETSAQVAKLAQLCRGLGA